jgi:drug/metabolite transporter (DMT)-like permease
MQIAAPHTTPLFTAAIRLLPSGAAVVAWAASRQRKGPRSYQAWLSILVFGIVDGTLFQGLLAEGLQRVPAGIGSVLIDSQPLTVAFVSALFFGESLSTLAMLGLFFGLSGLMLLEVPPDVLACWAHLDFGMLSNFRTNGAALCRSKQTDATP